MIFTDNQQTEPPNSTVPKVAETGQPIWSCALRARGMDIAVGAGKARWAKPRPKVAETMPRVDLTSTGGDYNRS